ncbi:hypothetical protein [Streptomyces sp. NPDC026673]|uniref:hypothetical protein n=1 Tax=Streptomyces sp. NPDC026673 TaxID=3155724 RepID=UPI0033D3CE7B
MDTSRRAELVIEALRYAVDLGFSEASVRMGEIAAHSTGNQMYGVCCALAESGRQTLIRMYGHPGPELLWALIAPDPADGEPGDPARTFSLQFISAFANGDLKTCEALYVAAAKGSADDYAHALIALLGDVANLARIEREEPAADQEAAPSHPH